jgi:fatty acid CoA ligase FadD9
MLFAEFQRELNRRGTDAADKPTLEAEIVAELRQKLVGGRYVSAMTSSAPISAELKAWVESFLDLSLVESYGSTEDGAVLVDGRVHRPPVTDYKLADVGDLGYFHTDRPHPRGELLVKSEELFAGYYRRPEVTAVAFDEDGDYRTGDTMAEIGSGRSSILTGAMIWSSCRRASSSRCRGWSLRSVTARSFTRSTYMETAPAPIWSP